MSKEENEKKQILSEYFKDIGKKGGSAKSKKKTKAVKKNASAKSEKKTKAAQENAANALKGNCMNYEEGKKGILSEYYTKLGRKGGKVKSALKTKVNKEIAIKREIALRNGKRLKNEIYEWLLNNPPRIDGYYFISDIAKALKAAVSGVRTNIIVLTTEGKVNYIKDERRTSPMRIYLVKDARKKRNREKNA